MINLAWNNTGTDTEMSPRYIYDPVTEPESSPVSSSWRIYRYNGSHHIVPHVGVSTTTNFVDGESTGVSNFVPDDYEVDMDDLRQAIMPMAAIIAHDRTVDGLAGMNLQQGARYIVQVRTGLRPAPPRMTHGPLVVWRARALPFYTCRD